MDKIYEEAKDLHVVATTIYTNLEDGVAYTDAECTKPFSVEELKDAFVKGALVKVENNLYQPVSYTEPVIFFYHPTEQKYILLTASEDEE